MKKCLRILIIFILCSSMSMNVYAATSAELRKQQEDQKKKLEETKKQLDDANSELNDLTKAQKGITDEIEAIDDEIVEVMASISIVEDEIEDTKNQIVVTQAELEEAERVEAEQYEAMKARVKYMYEKGNAEYVSMLLNAQSTADLVNKVDYIEQLYGYDRTKLEEYIATKEKVAEKKAQLLEEQEELETSMYELEQEKAELDTMLEEKKAQEEDYENKIAKAKQEAATYKAKIKQQNAEIRKTEEAARKAAEEEAAKKAAQEEAAKKAAQENGDSAEGDDSGSDSGTESGNDSTSQSQSQSSYTPASGGRGSDVANFACQFVGNPYVAGGTSLTNGADCSGFTLAVYKNFGYSLPRSSTAQRGAGVGVTYAEAQPGDIICYAGHVALYIGNGQIVHASTPSSGIKIGNATYKEILAVRRIIQ